MNRFCSCFVGKGERQQVCFCGSAASASASDPGGGGGGGTDENNRPAGRGGGAKNERKLMGKAVSYGRENGLRKKVSPL